MSVNTILKHFITWCAGAVCGGLFAFAIFHPLAKTMLAGETELSDKIQDIYSQGTLLYEPNPGTQAQSAPGIRILDGLATVTLNGVYPQGPKQPDRVARWYIPMKVQPVVYGDGRGTLIVYVDVKTNGARGAFVPPSVQPQ